MSRRKQAKPRAFLKVGESGIDCDEEQLQQQRQQKQQKSIDLLDPKEEIFSDNENDDDDDDDQQSCDDDDNDVENNDDNDDEDVCQEHEAKDKPKRHHPPHKTDNSNTSKNTNNTIATTSNSNKNNNNGSTNHNNIIVDIPTNGITANALESSRAVAELREFRHDAAAAAGVDANGKGCINPLTMHAADLEEENEQEDLHNIVNEDDIDDDDDDVDYDEDEDLHSLDSYYSDMYSTHTSSSYSPSISDGTMTPNSMHLHHHPHHMHHPHAQLPHLPTQQHAADEEGAQTRRQRTALHNNGNGNAPDVDRTNAEAEDDAENSNTLEDDVDVDKKRNEESSSCLNGTNNSSDNLVEQQRQQQHQHHHRYRLGRCRTAGLDGHTIKLPNKLRKADRDAAGGGGGGAGKFDKLTSDGIKSAADGSYQCQFCDKSFPRLGYLKKHEQSHAEHLPFKCDYCARLFKHKRSRDRHTKLHTGDRRYKCPHCEAAFSRSDHLKIHMKTHDNQKPFQCTICNRGYNTAAALTSHMQNHKKQAAIIAAGGNPQALNYSPRSTGSASSNGSLHKRRYAMTAASDCSSPSRLEYPKRLRSNFLNCTYCTKNDFTSLEQLNAHIQSMHEKDLVAAPAPPPQTLPLPNATDHSQQTFQLNCEYCTMKFPNIPSMFQHMRTTHIDRLTSPNSYFEHFNRLAASGTFSPRLIATAKTMQRGAEEAANIKQEQNLSPKSCQDAKQEEPTDLSQNKRQRSVTPISPQHSSPRTPEKQPPGVFFCNQCNAGLPDFESFRNHLKSHIAQGLNLVCHHCGLALREQSEYERHVISHFLITNSEFNCAANCNKSYGKPEELQKHLLDAHAITMYKCALCAELFETKVAIQVHFACAHSQETKILRCSACMEVFRNEQDFNLHVKMRHQTVNGSSNSNTSLQCMFCRTVCSSDLEMHFHLAAHARQYRCPSCAETFHVEFLLDRHMQSHHGGNERPTLLPTPTKDNNFEEHSPIAVNNNNNNNNQLSPMNTLYVNALFGKSPLMPLAAAQQNNNNSILDYNVAFAAAHLNKGLFPAAAAAAATAGKFYSPLQVDTGAMKHPALMYGLGQRYFDTNRTLIDMYNQHQQQQDKVNMPTNGGNYFISPKMSANAAAQEASVNSCKTPAESNVLSGFSCGMCERNDFRTDAELHSHRKIVHNIKTGVSLRCAYCSGNFKSRSELEHHMKTCHNSTGKHKCLICDEIFPSPAILAEHKLQHSKVGQSGKCSHCTKPLNDVAAFKGHLSEHNTEGQVPVQCICCRQSLHSDFEIGLHAKFHTKSSNMPETVCALCLEPIPNATNEAKVCEKCCRKHNFNNKFNKQRENYESRPLPIEPRHYIENRCNLCKMILPHPQKLQEHLVEHTFAGCEDRGFICYICSAVFTAPAGLLNHMNEHGQNARPYDCNLCTEKYYFRAELDHHLVEHELRENIAKELTPDNKQEQTREAHNETQESNSNVLLSGLATEVKKEIFEGLSKTEIGTAAAEEDDEYIEVEKVPERAETTEVVENEKHHPAADDTN